VCVCVCVCVSVCVCECVCVCLRVCARAHGGGSVDELVNYPRSAPAHTFPFCLMHPILLTFLNCFAMWRALICPPLPQSLFLFPHRTVLRFVNGACNNPSTPPTLHSHVSYANASHTGTLFLRTVLCRFVNGACNNPSTSRQSHQSHCTHTFPMLTLPTQVPYSSELFSAAAWVVRARRINLLW
jgi:hypothetical protein